MVRSGIHVGIIMDGNGRWAARRGLPRSMGHRAGARAVRRVVEAAPGLGIETLTLFAFSADNWNRPAAEVAVLHQLLCQYLERETARCLREGVTLQVIGRRDRLPGNVIEAVARTEAATRAGGRLRLRLAVDYSAREAIARAAAGLPEGATPLDLATRLHPAEPAAVCTVDLIIRTGGEQRLSDFLLWEAAYAELVFAPPFWPDFTAADLAAAVAEYHRRDRRFGGLSAAG